MGVGTGRRPGWGRSDVARLRRRVSQARARVRRRRAPRPARPAVRRARRLLRASPGWGRPAARGSPGALHGRSRSEPGPRPALACCRERRRLRGPRSTIAALRARGRGLAQPPIGISAHPRAPEAVGALHRAMRSTRRPGIPRSSSVSPLDSGELSRRVSLREEQPRRGRDRSAIYDQRRERCAKAGADARWPRPPRPSDARRLWPRLRRTSATCAQTIREREMERAIRDWRLLSARRRDSPAAGPGPVRSRGLGAGRDAKAAHELIEDEVVVVVAAVGPHLVGDLDGQRVLRSR